MPRPIEIFDMGAQNSIKGDPGRVQERGIQRFIVERPSRKEATRRDHKPLVSPRAKKKQQEDQDTEPSHQSGGRKSVCSCFKKEKRRRTPPFIVVL